MRSSLVVRASDCQCTSCNGPGFDPSICRHSGIWGAADEALLNIVWKIINKPKTNIYFFEHQRKMFTFLALGDASSPSESSTNKKFLCFCPIFWDHFGLLGSGSWTTDPIESWFILDPDYKHFILQTSNSPGLIFFLGWCNVAFKFFCVFSFIKKCLILNDKQFSTVL